MLPAACERRITEMKKAYSKPQIVFESFAVCTSIAACDVDTNLPTKGSCGLQYGPEETLFIDSTTGCSWQVDDGYDNTCYHNPTADQMLFAS